MGDLPWAPTTPFDLAGGHRSGTGLRRQRADAGSSPGRRPWMAVAGGSSVEAGSRGGGSGGRTRGGRERGAEGRGGGTQAVAARGVAGTPAAEGGGRGTAAAALVEP